MYGKLFAQMYDGTLGTRGPWQALVTFQQMIILADQDGVVDMTANALARRTTIPLAIIKLGIVELEKADPDSRSPDEDGRRIVPLTETRTWGWRIVNYGKYRELRTAEERRAYHRQYWREKRSKTSPLSTDSPLLSTDSTDSTETQQTQPIAVSSKQKQKQEVEEKEKRGSAEPPQHISDIMLKLPPEHRAGVLLLAQQSPNALSFVGQLDGLLQGMRGPPIVPELLGRALTDMATNGDPPRMALLRAYIKRAAVEDQGLPAGASPNGAAAREARNVDVIKDFIRRHPDGNTDSGRAGVGDPSGDVPPRNNGHDGRGLSHGAA